MDELIDRVASATGLDAATARQAVVLILGFVAKEGPAEDVAALSASIPGAQGAIDAAEAEEGGGGAVMRRPISPQSSGIAQGATTTRMIQSSRLLRTSNSRGLF